MSTRERRDNGDTPFGAWMRNHSELDSRIIGLDAENIDYTLLLYRRGFLSLLEEKIGYGNFPSGAQQDTHGIIDQALDFAFNHSNFQVKRHYPGRPDKIRYRGYHLVQFEKTNPSDGGSRLNGMPITENDLLLFMKGDQEPLIQYKTMEKHRGKLLKIMKCNTIEELDALRKRPPCKWCDNHRCKGCFKSLDEIEKRLLIAVWKEEMSKIESMQVFTF